MAKTVTLKAARRGATAVQVGKHTFEIGIPVDGVPDAVIERLKTMPDVQVDVGKPAASNTEKTQPGGAA